MNVGKSKVMGMETERVAHQIRVRMNVETMDFVNSFKFLRSYFSEDGGLQKDLKTSRVRD